MSPCVNTPTSLPLRIVTPASSAALKLARLRVIAGGLRRLPFLPAGVLRRRVAGGERRAERDVVLGHQLEDLRRAAVAVLDRFDAGQHGAAHPFRRARVRDDRPAAAPRRLDDRS